MSETQYIHVCMNTVMTHIKLTSALNIHMHVHAQMRIRVRCRIPDIPEELK
jgi:hypothetical protein